MTVFTLDGTQYVDVGAEDIWQALLSTVTVRLNGDDPAFQAAARFLQTRTCAAQDGLNTARSMNFVRDALSGVSPNDMVYDANDPSRTAPWAQNISSVITSCANYFTTADGKDLLAELVGILTYAFYAQSDVSAE